MKLHYLGPPGSFSQEAAQILWGKKNLFPEGSIEEVIEAVKKDTLGFGVVPVENSIEGIVIRTLDLLLENKLHVITELNLQIKQNLLTQESSLKKIHTIYSHPQALAQSRLWLKKHLPKAELKSTTSTSRAAEIVSQEKGAAAIGSIQAAKRNDLKILVKNISNNKRINLTRFWLITPETQNVNPLSKNQILLPTKTSSYIIIKDKVGALRDLLDTFARNHISFTSIQSRPLPEAPWKYGFFIDILVDAKDPLAKKMLSELKKEHPEVTILGSYPQLGNFNKNAIIKYNVERIKKIFAPNRSHPIIKKILSNIHSTVQKDSKIPNYIKKILETRLLIMPSVALYKLEHKSKIYDPKREEALLQKMKTHTKFHKLYKQVFQRTKETQKKIMLLLKAGKISTHNIQNFSIDELRYYIDYLDTLVLML